MRRMSGSVGIVELQRQMIVQLHSRAGEREEVSVSPASFDDTVAYVRPPPAQPRNHAMAAAELTLLAPRTFCSRYL